MEEFFSEWKTRGNEKSDCQQFWNSMLRNFWQIENLDEVMRFEVPVKLENSTGFIDVWIPKTRVIIEQKSRGKNLARAEKQSDGSMKTPFDQAKRYDDHRKTSEKARWIVTCNFDEFWIYNLDTPRPNQSVNKIRLEELPERFRELNFLVDENESESKTSEYVSASVGALIQEFRDLFVDSIETMSQIEIESLNKLCIRLVFCLYSEDAGLFELNSFRDYLKETRNKNSLIDFKNDLTNLFLRLNTKDLPRLLKFPYVNGSLFDGESLEILDRLDGRFDLRGMLDKLIFVSERKIWNKISPTIFGSIFESIMNPDTKRSGGIHYTSPENIHKVIDPLFLDALNREFENGDLEKLHDKIANLKFLDPACGSGNFLTETYISLRKLENRIIEKIGGSIQVSIENFYGIEINDFAVQVAKLALWISEHQMNGGSNFLPLTRNANIIEGNSLEIDWKEIVSNADFIMGNPPYIGRRYRTKKQAEEISRFFSYKDVDYVACWIKKASDYIRNSRTEVAFVTTNSITQGEQVFPIWKDLFDDGIKINFAWSTFKWENELKKSMAQVFCVIVGFSRFDRSKKLLDGVEVKQINGYLLDAPNVCIERISRSLCRMPMMRMGNQATDGGNLIIESEDLDAFLERDPRSKKFIRRYMMGEEFLHNKPRYCLWLVDAEPNEIKSIKPIYERVEACRKDRLKGAPDRQKLAETPWLFREQINPEHFVAIPIVSAGNRKYIPIGFLDSSIIAGNKLLIVPEGSLDLFGILTSSVHMIWMKAVGSFIGSSYSYSAQIVYNNFPFPKSNPKIESTAQKILDARSNHPNSSLADLYDPNLMPIDLRKAHEENDLAVIEAYQFPKNISESEIVSRLFSMYENLTLAKEVKND